MKERLRHTGPGAARARNALVLAGAIGLCSAFARSGGDAETVESARAALDKWVETERIISQEKRDWGVGKELVTERIDLVKREIDSLHKSIDEAQESIAGADEKRAKLLEESERLKRASSALTEAVTGFEARTSQLLARLPEPIRERVKPLSQRMPEDPATTESSLGERFQNVVGILDQVNKFQRDVTVTSEVRTLENGRSAEVTALYLGVGQAFYATSDGTAAGVGRATAEGWKWTAANEAAPEIAEAIAILANDQVARFVRVPMRVE